MEFHEKLQLLRKQKGITQEKLAEALFVSRTAVSKWESGKGYPGIDSLKRIAEFYGVTVDELLSGDQVLTIAKAEQTRTKGHFLDLAYGLIDLSGILLFLLPLFAEKSGGKVSAVSLLGLSSVSVWLQIAYFAVVLGLMGMGVLTLALQNWQNRGWGKWKSPLSLVVSGVGVLLFTVGLHPYAAVFLLVLGVVKGILLLKKG